MSLNTSVTLPRRGEIWLVNFDPTIGSEIQKIRPAIVISSDAVGKLPLKIVLPLTEWKDLFERNIWHIKVIPDRNNGLTKESAADALQIRSMAIERFDKRIGRISADILEEIVTALAAVVEYK